MPTLLEIANHLCMSESNASSLCRAMRVNRKVVTLDEIREKYILDLREKAAGRGGDDQGELTRARIRDTNASANLREIQFFESTGQLVSVDDFEILLSAWATQARSEFINGINKIIGDIEGAHDVQVDREVVDGHSRSALEAVGNYPKRTTGADKNN